jgi:hypothetical protein
MKRGRVVIAPWFIPGAISERWFNDSRTGFSYLTCSPRSCLPGGRIISSEKTDSIRKKSLELSGSRRWKVSWGGEKIRQLFLTTSSGSRVESGCYGTTNTLTCRNSSCWKYSNIRGTRKNYVVPWTISLGSRLWGSIEIEPVSDSHCYTKAAEQFSL